MKFSFFGKKKKKPTLTPIQKMDRQLVARRHESRIENLKDELEKIGRELERIELDTEIPKGVKAKQSDLIIKRMSLVDYEIGIRESLLKWL